MNGRMAQVLGGLMAGDKVVEYPSAQLRDGMSIRQRQMSETSVAQASETEVTIAEPLRNDLAKCARRPAAGSE
jgi:hypothetical protein